MTRPGLLPTIYRTGGQPMPLFYLSINCYGEQDISPIIPQYMKLILKTKKLLLVTWSGIDEILNYSRLSVFYPPGLLLKMPWVTAWYKIRYSYHNISYYKCISSHIKSNNSGTAKVKIFKNERDAPLFTGKLLIKFQNILRNTTQVIIRHRVKILFSVISSPITLERQKWKSLKMKGILLSSLVSCW